MSEPGAARRPKTNAWLEYSHTERAIYPGFPVTNALNAGDEAVNELLAALAEAEAEVEVEVVEKAHEASTALREQVEAENRALRQENEELEASRCVECMQYRADIVRLEGELKLARQWSGR